MAKCSHCGQLSIEGLWGRCPGCDQDCCRDCAAWPEEPCAGEARDKEQSTWTEEDWEHYYEQQDELCG